ncbi:Protein SOGA1 [Liparis tanakae]|uniref:Protein SOGA1 n=1 Tax=Liparis tanakae TaxID=230148 RepID=A0A4Z2G6B0_9TELE|nr:Protein SOGA1 [Liparis tanakae]
MARGPDPARLHVSSGPWSSAHGLARCKASLACARIVGAEQRKTHNVGFIDNFNLFWDRSSSFRKIGIRLNKLGSRLLAAKLHNIMEGLNVKTLGDITLSVAKDVSIRLHSQLDNVEKKRSRLEQENEELRVRLQDLEVAKQVLQQEIDKVGPGCVSLCVGPCDATRRHGASDPPDAETRRDFLPRFPCPVEEVCLEVGEVIGYPHLKSATRMNGGGQEKMGGGQEGAGGARRRRAEAKSSRVEAGRRRVETGGAGEEAGGAQLSSLTSCLTSDHSVETGGFKEASETGKTLQVETRTEEPTEEERGGDAQYSPKPRGPIYSSCLTFEGGQI